MTKIELLLELNTVDAKLEQSTRYTKISSICKRKNIIIDELEKMGHISNEEYGKYLLSEDWNFTPKIK